MLINTIIIDQYCFINFIILNKDIYCLVVKKINQ